MRQLLIVMLLLAGGLTSAVPAAAQTDWTLVWNDEFDGASLDMSKWAAANNCGDQRNGEQQCYMADDVSVANGVLTIKSERRTQGGFSFTSGAVRTSDNFTQAYGRFEFSARLPVGGQGVWPALWLFPTDQWPPEIDVLEAVNDMRTIYMTYHWGSTTTHQQDSSAVAITNPSTQNHVYAVEWEPGEVRWYIDGALVKTHSGSDVTNVPMQVYINTALGGSWPGAVAASTVFPQQMTIDYVRVYASGGSAPGDTTAPTVTVTAPTASSTVTGATTLSASASDNVGVSSVWFTVDGTTVGAEDTAAPFSASWNSGGVANGSHAIRAVARDAAGNTKTSNPVTVTVSNGSSSSDTVAPNVALTAPTSGSSVTGTSTLTATASDSVGVTGVQFLVDGASVGALDTNAPYTYAWSSTTVANGSHAVQAMARDAAGNTRTSSAVSITVSNGGSSSGDTTAPTVSMTSPANNSTISATATLRANAGDNVGVASVQFTVDGVNVGVADTASPFNYAWPTTTVTNGSHLVRAVARDAAGNTRTSDALAVNVNNASGGGGADTTAPSVAFTSPAPNAFVSGRVALNATASDNVGVSQVTFMVDGRTIGTDSTGSSYGVTWSTSYADNGTHTLAAVARDAAGNTKTATVTVTVRNNRMGR